MRSLFAALLIGSFLTSIAPVSANAATLMPPGNQNIDQPDVPGSSSRRTKQLQTTYEQKYRKIYRLLESDSRLRDKIRKTSADYGISPIHMVGAIIGEHTYNVDAYDQLQTYYVKAASYLSSAISFGYKSESVADFVNRPQFETCQKITDSYDLWACRERVWDRDFSGKEVDGIEFPRNRFSAVFFQPLYAGQTFGLGQLNPLTALQMSDLVHEVSRLPRLSVNEPVKVYETIMDPDMTLAYVAATIKTSIDAYRDIAGFDISSNPGITATLYNIGSPEERARVLRDLNKERVAKGEPERLPQENYYGWLVNDRIKDLEKLF